MEITSIGKSFCTAFIAILSSIIITTVSQGATFNVSDSASFQNALTNSAGNGQNDTINVAGGTYSISSTLIFNSFENYTLTIAGSETSSTHLNGGDAVQILACSTTAADADIIVKNISFGNGMTAANGGALNLMTITGDITLENCEVADSAATGGDSVGGGALLTSDSGRINVLSSEFLRNRSSGNVGGLFLGTNSGSFNLTNCTFEENSVNNTGGSEAFGDGGGAMIYSDGASQADIHGNVFRNNSAAGGSNPDGGGLMTYQMGAVSELNLENNEFSNNTAGLGGGGAILRFNTDCIATVRDNIFSSNQTQIGSGAGVLVYINEGSLTYSDNSHTDNNCAEDGGGAWLNVLSGTAIISGNTFSLNQTANNGGGASVTTDSATIDILNNIFDTNTSVNVGGGLSGALTTGEMNVYNNTFYGNSVSNEGGGGAIYLYMDQDQARPTVYNNILWHDTPDEFSYSYGSGTQTMVMTYSDVENGTGQPWFGIGCISTDPLFTDSTGNDFSLSWTGYPNNDATMSPAINSGDPASPLDTDNTIKEMGARPYVQQTVMLPVQTYLVLTDNSVMFDIPSTARVQVTGSPQANILRLAQGAQVRCQNFTGPNIIVFEGTTAQQFTIRRAEDTVLLVGDSGTILQIDAQTTSQTLYFADGSLNLAITGGNLMLGSQQITSNDVAVEASGNGAVFTPPVTHLPSSIQTYLLLTNESCAFELPYGSFVEVIGSAGANTINVSQGARLSCLNFAGSNTLNIYDNTNELTVSRSGATVYITASNGTQIRIPATTVAQTLRFANGSSDLVILNGKVWLGNQEITMIDSPLGAPVNSSDISAF